MAAHAAGPGAAWAAEWAGPHHGPGPMGAAMAGPPRGFDPEEFARFERMRGGGAAASAAAAASGAAASMGPAPPAQELNPALSAFLESSRAGVPFRPPELRPGVSLPVEDAVKIRDRATIVARHMFAERGAEADARVDDLLRSFRVDPRALPSAAPRGFEEAWVAGPPRVGAAGAERAADAAASAALGGPQGGWADEFGKLSLGGPAGAAARGAGGVPGAAPAGAAPAGAALSPGERWAAEHAGELAGDPAGWADAFIHQAAEGTALRRAAAGAPPDAAVREQSRRLAEVLGSAQDPKLRNSQFMQFVSKMSRGENIQGLEAEAEQAKAAGGGWANEFAGPGAAAAAPGGWAGEFAGQGAAATAAPGGPSPWAEEFSPGAAAAAAAGRAGARLPAETWAEDFATQVRSVGGATAVAAPAAGDWADAFADGVAGGLDDWSAEFSELEKRGLAPPPEGVDAGAWEAEFARDLEKLNGAGGVRAAGEYVMAENNPFLGDPNALARGKELFRQGVLSEAALALEAAAQADPTDAEAWRLLGTVHAENDDDERAIRAMRRALAAGPDDPDVLLALGVSHANELDTSEAAGHLMRWAETAPEVREAAARAAERLRARGEEPRPGGVATVTGLRALLAEMASDPAVAAASPDVHVALGVAATLARDHPAAAEAFRRALELRPQDYSLWNKLGATLANSAHSDEALAAYRRALEAKPNYVRAWTNLGISHTNLGEYDAAARFYVRALALNPKATAVWSYLRTALICAGKSQLQDLVEKEDVQALQKELPL